MYCRGRLRNSPRISRGERNSLCETAGMTTGVSDHLISLASAWPSGPIAAQFRVHGGAEVVGSC